MTTKQELRQYIRNKKREYSPEQLGVLTLPLIDRLLSHPKVREATHIMLYYSLLDEVNTHSVIDVLAKSGKRIFLPKVISDTEMTIHPYRTKSDLSLGSFNIMEPNTPPCNEFGITPAQTCQSDKRKMLVIIPGIAFDPEGHRLGRGKGYYDRFLASTTAYKIGLCFPFQFVDEVPHSAYDIPMDEVIH